MFTRSFIYIATYTSPLLILIHNFPFYIFIIHPDWTTRHSGSLPTSSKLEKILNFKTHKPPHLSQDYPPVIPLHVIARPGYVIFPEIMGSNILSAITLTHLKLCHDLIYSCAVSKLF